LRDLLVEAIDYEFRTDEKWWQWLGTEEAQGYASVPIRQTWGLMDARERGRWLTAQLWNCTDIMAAMDLSRLDLEPGHTYAQVVRRLRRDVDDSPKRTGRPPKFGEAMIPLHVTIPRDLGVSLNVTCTNTGITKADAVRQAVEAWICAHGAVTLPVSDVDDERATLG